MSVSMSSFRQSNPVAFSNLARKASELTGISLVRKDHQPSTEDDDAKRRKTNDDHSARLRDEWERMYTERREYDERSQEQAQNTLMLWMLMIGLRRNPSLAFGF